MIIAAAATGWRGAGRLVLGTAVATITWMGFMAYRTLALGAPWFLTVQSENVGGARLAPVADWPARAESWANFATHLASGWVWLLIWAGILVAMWTRRPASLALAAYVIGYFGLLVIVTFPIFDRYALFLLGPIALLGAVGLARAPGRRAMVLAVAVAIAAAPGALAAVRGDVELGTRTRTTVYGGFEDVCTWIRERATGHVVWHHSLSWHFAYCLQGVELYAYWFPDPTVIEPKGRAPTYLVLGPGDDPAVVDQLRRRDLVVELEVALQSPGHARFEIFTVMRPLSEASKRD